jgi:hypothetical protein
MLLIVPRDKLLDRMADIMSLNVAHRSREEAYTEPMTQDVFEKYSFVRRRVFVQVDLTYEMPWMFFNLGIFQRDPLNTGVTFPQTFTIRDTVYRGY